MSGAAETHREPLFRAQSPGDRDTHSQSRTWPSSCASTQPSKDFAVSCPSLAEQKKKKKGKKKLGNGPRLPFPHGCTVSSTICPCTSTSLGRGSYPGGSEGGDPALSLLQHSPTVMCRVLCDPPPGRGPWVTGKCVE